MLRKLLLSIVIAVVVLIIAAVVAVLVFDPNKYREEIAAHASDRLGREVRLEGPVELALFPWLAVDIHDVSIGNPDDFPQARSEERRVGRECTWRERATSVRRR